MESREMKLLREQLTLCWDMKVQYVIGTKLDQDDYTHSLGYLEALRRVEQIIDDLGSRED